MNRNGALIALAIAAAVGLLFALYPDLDIKISEYFFAPDDPRAPWMLGGHYQARLREAAASLIALIISPAIGAIVVKLVLPRARMWIPGRTAVLMIVTLVLAPGLVTNVILKDHWGRPRPIDLTVFDGDDQFVPWWDPRGTCPKNCSFVAGEPSGAFWTLAPAAVVPPQWRTLAYGAAVAFGAAVGVLRMAAGAHFFSDVVFAGVFSFLVIWLVHGLLYRWRPTRTTDAALEGTLERMLAWRPGKPR